MIGYKSSTHSTDFDLKGIFYEGTSDQIIILSFETLKISLHFVDWIIDVIFPVYYVVSYRACSSSFDLEHIRIAILVDITTINLRSEQHLIIY